MSLFITALASGSNGNCYYIGNDKEAVLIDAGIHCKELEKRMSRLGLSMKNVKAVFISHEHADHIRGLAGFAKKWSPPIYITTPTLHGGRLKLDLRNVKSFQCSETITIGKLQITPFSKRHDAADPHSFIIESKGVKVGVFTDIGAPCDKLAFHFGQCHAAFLESNYDEHMLEVGGYPYFLKKRIRGGNGHLSNKQALEVFNTHRSPFMSHLFLSHLSENNNCPKLVSEMFNEIAQGAKIIVTSREEETALYHISGMANHIAKSHAPSFIYLPASQLELSF